MTTDPIIPIPPTITPSPLDLSDDQLVTKYVVKHHGGSWFLVDGLKIEGKAKAEAYAAQMIQLHRSLAVPDLSSKLPSGFSIRDRSDTLIWRDSVMELAMNETHMPTGKATNPFYDREWYYAWGSALSKTDISERRARGYDTVSLEALEKGIDDQKIPDHYRNLLRPHENLLYYGDSVLMRVPRIWREGEDRDAAMLALERIRSTDKESRDNMENTALRSHGTGRPIASHNEVQIKF